ncbi:unnamed protein product [Rotaria sp. Silwood1]|nr:unnamed protein product [Rotaria sp. Silwood1]CAF3690232.1 unnamed protein product [Rotaria sp. Silwood1]CAF4593716.1 unnamed protein product [Rotaria sp. Silwood1]CAF4694241.1 unnamed protein product [Rotaria sp. Silwood1]CAF4698121.1 unnamed protein product [Rotaria sp. Silwood1]
MTTSTSTTSTTSSTTTSTTTSTTSTSTSSTTTSTTTSTTSSTTSTTTTTETPTCATWLWNTTGETVAGITGSPGSNSSQLNEPWNIYVDQTNGTLYIADSKNHRIQRWLAGATSGTTIAGTGISGSGATSLNIPRDVFVDSAQNIYVADSANNRIQYFPYGNTTGLTVSSSWTSAGSLWGVQVVNNTIYACDNSNSAIWKNGSAVAGNQGTGAGSNKLNLPQGFAVDISIAVGTVYAVNSQQHTIVQWLVGATSGNVVAGMDGTAGSTSTQLRYPVSIKLDSYTNMFVVDNNNHRIQLFCRYPIVNLTARTIAGTGVSGQTSQTFTYPAGIALDASLNLYVSDTSNHRIQKFRRLL